MKSVYRKYNLVYKTHNLGTAWERKFTKILDVIEIPAFVRFKTNGYITQFIDGVDLQEDLPFQPRHDKVRSYPLNPIQRKRVIKIFKDIVYAGLVTHYILADFTKRNIIMKKNVPYLIDYDVIIEGELSKDYVAIFQTMLNYLAIPYHFDGNLEALYERLG